jgi:hypothetical protein
MAKQGLVHRLSGQRQALQAAYRPEQKAGRAGAHGHQGEKSQIRVSGVHEVKKITVADFLEEYLTWAIVNKGVNTYTLNRFCTDPLREAFTDHLSGIAAKQVEDYKVKRRAVVSPATVNRELALAQTDVHEGGRVGLSEGKPAEFSQIPEGTSGTPALSHTGGDGYPDRRVFAPSPADCSGSLAYGHAERGGSVAHVAGHRLWCEHHHDSAHEEQ